MFRYLRDAIVGDVRLKPKAFELVQLPRHFCKCLLAKNRQLSPESFRRTVAYLSLSLMRCFSPQTRIKWKFTPFGTTANITVDQA